MLKKMFVMKSDMSKYIKLIAVPIIFILFNIGITNLVNHKLDLTEDKLFTLTNNTKQVISNINEPIRIQLFFSNSLSKDLPQVRDYEKRVRELLYKYVSLSENLKLEVLDPKPFSDLEDLANVYGVQGLQLNQEGERFYFGAVFTNSVDDSALIPFFDSSRESFLEYDLTKTIYNLANTKKSKIGIISSLPISGGFSNERDPASYQQPFFIKSNITEFFNVEDLPKDVEAIPEEIDQLLVIHPKNLSDETTFAIDQFVMSGKGVIFFMDPFSEYENSLLPPNQRASNIPGSNLNNMFEKWGFKLDPGLLAGDINNGRKVSMGDINNQKIITYVLWLAIQDSLLSRDDIITSNLDYVFIKTAGSILNNNTNSSLLITPLIQTSLSSMLIERSAVQFRADPEKLLKDFISSNQKLTLGARIQGNFKSSFSEEEFSKLKTKKEKYIKQVNNANIIVYADTDLLADNTWVSQQDMFGRNNATAIADNGRLVLNSIESMSGGPDLIGLRGRGTSNRPFVVVENLQKKAELAFKEKEETLQNELKETEEKLQVLQSEEGADNNNVSNVQAETIVAFRSRIFEIRGELRAVQRVLGQDINALETRLKFINIWLMPALVFVLYIINSLILYRRQKNFFKSIGRT